MGARFSRVPEEPAAPEHGGKLHRLIEAFDFSSVQDPQGSDAYNAAVNTYAARCIEEGVFLTQSSHEQWTRLRERDGVTCELLQIVGTSIPIIRHTAEINGDAAKLFDTYNRLSYTSAIDVHSVLVSGLEVIPADMPLKWLQVVRTLDKMPMPLTTMRDFITLDMVDGEKLLFVSKSVLNHPKQPVTDAPGCCSGLFASSDSTCAATYRMPVMKAFNVEQMAGGRCRVVQVQWSDVGGAVSTDKMGQSIATFGFENIGRFQALADETREQGLSVGPTASDYLANPLLPCWRQNPADMLPGFKKAVQPAS